MKNKHPHKLISNFIGCLLFLLTACHENMIYHSYQPINPIGWYKNDTLTYYLKTSLANKNITEIEIGIRHLDSYLYKDIWLGITPIYKDSTQAASIDSLHLYLADTEGLWKGTGIGELKQFVQTHKRISKQSANDSIIGFKLFHLMADYPLKGINDIGICLKKD